MECLGSQYYEDSSGTCRSCHNTCRSCSGPGRFSCTACSRPLRLDRLNNQCVPCCSERGIAANCSSTPDCCHCNTDNGECINSSVAGKRRIAEWGALHTVTNERTSPGISSVALTVFAAAAAVFLAALFALQMRSVRRPKANVRGVVYSPLACNEEGDVVASAEFAVVQPANERKHDHDHNHGHDHEHEPLLEHST